MGKRRTSKLAHTLSPALHTGVPEKGTGPILKHTQPQSGAISQTSTLQHFIFVVS